MRPMVQISERRAGFLTPGVLLISPRPLMWGPAVVFAALQEAPAGAVSGSWRPGNASRPIAGTIAPSGAFTGAGAVPDGLVAGRAR